MLTVENKPIDHVTSLGDVISAVPRIELDFMSRYRDAYRNELEHFLDVIEGRLKYTCIHVHLCRSFPSCYVAYNNVYTSTDFHLVCCKIVLITNIRIFVLHITLHVIHLVLPYLILA